MILVLCLFGPLLCCVVSNAYRLENWPDRYVEDAMEEYYYYEDESLDDMPIYEPLQRQPYHIDENPRCHQRMLEKAQLKETLLEKSLLKEETSALAREDTLLVNDFARERLLLDNLNSELVEDEWEEIERRGRSSLLSERGVTPTPLGEDFKLVPVAGKVTIVGTFNNCGWNMPPTIPMPLPVPIPSCDIVNDVNLPLRGTVPVDGNVVIGAHFGNHGSMPMPDAPLGNPCNFNYGGGLVPVRGTVPVNSKVVISAHFDNHGAMPIPVAPSGCPCDYDYGGGLMPIRGTVPVNGNVVIGAHFDNCNC